MRVWMTERDLLSVLVYADSLILSLTPLIYWGRQPGSRPDFKQPRKKITRRREQRGELSHVPHSTRGDGRAVLFPSYSFHRRDRRELLFIQVPHSTRVCVDMLWEREEERLVVVVILAGRILSQWSSASRGESGERSRANGIISAWRPPVTIRDGRL